MIKLYILEASASSLVSSTLRSYYSSCIFQYIYLSILIKLLKANQVAASRAYNLYYNFYYPHFSQRSCHVYYRL